MVKFKIGDKILPKANGRFAHQRTIGIQIIIAKESDGSCYDWMTNKGYSYVECDIELAVLPREKIKLYGIVTFCNTYYK